MNIPEIFKYNILISSPLFSLIALLLVSKAPNFSLTKNTVSKSIFHLEQSKYKTIFKLNFLLKALLDFGFFWYVINHFQIPIISLLGSSLVLSAVFFGLLAYFTEVKHSLAHNILIYGNIILLSFSQILLAQLTRSPSFILFTNIITTVVVMISFGFLFTKKTNVYVQITCVLIVYTWLLLFVFRYL